MPIIRGFSEIDEAQCAVTLYEDTDPIMVNISISGSSPLHLTMDEAVCVREALEQMLDLFLDVGEDEETVH